MHWLDYSALLTLPAKSKAVSLAKLASTYLKPLQQFNLIHTYKEPTEVCAVTTLCKISKTAARATTYSRCVALSVWECTHSYLL